jgi:hypothetical protein
MSDFESVKKSIQPWIKKCSEYYEGTKWDDEYDSQCWALLVHILDFADSNNCLLEAVDWLSDLSTEKFLNKKELSPCGNMILIKAHQLIDVQIEIEDSMDVSDMTDDEYREHLTVGYRKLIEDMTEFVPHQLQLEK